MKNNNNINFFFFTIIEEFCKKSGSAIEGWQTRTNIYKII